ncbi:Rrf2 family transcriptional regulator [Lactobacillus sp. PV037]|uniref:Rrf2 family transcriptional regulator n=1 Tax=unclassified Lactobacillus TaxID=2620435 RepID=UPI0022403A97|nr:MULTISPECIES: Rrf2 family transcriptional regulator [unclassified Lactobacillus]QNQ82660.1 Rrf2 family transcriptional regulator [Lactobacillus sp. PV012]QNQ83224.1 Rrf2 family transcriptional regulator [Lactobacillus sp. PV037]
MANTRLSDLLQILVYLKVHDGEKITSQRLASSLNTNPSLVRSMLVQLRSAGLLESVKGKPHLVKDLNKVTVFDVYQAIEPQKNLLQVDNNTSQVCSVGVAFPEVLDKHYQEVQKLANEKMKQVTLQQLVNETKENIDLHQKIH